jgi:hypothetical protein
MEYDDPIQIRKASCFPIVIIKLKDKKGRLIVENTIGIFLKTFQEYL